MTSQESHGGPKLVGSMAFVESSLDDANHVRLSWRPTRCWQGLLMLVVVLAIYSGIYFSGKAKLPARKSRQKTDVVDHLCMCFQLNEDESRGVTLWNACCCLALLPSLLYLELEWGQNHASLVSCAILDFIIMSTCPCICCQAPALPIYLLIPCDS